MAEFRCSRENFQRYYVFGRWLLGGFLGKGCISDIATACCIGTEQFRAQLSRLFGVAYMATRVDLRSLVLFTVPKSVWRKQ